MVEVSYEGLQLPLRCCPLAPPGQDKSQYVGQLADRQAQAHGFSVDLNSQKCQLGCWALRVVSCHWHS